MSGSRSGGSSSQTQQIILPDYINQASQDVLNSGNAVASRQYQANPNLQLVAPTADQTTAYQMVRDSVGQADPYYQQGIDALTPLLGSAGPVTTDQVNAATTSLLNPYSDIVVDPTLALMRQDLNTSLNAERGRAAQAGSFGGSRLGVLEGNAISQNALRAGQLEGQLLSAGFENAATRATNLLQRNQAAGITAASVVPTLATSRVQQDRIDAGMLEQIGREIQAQQQAEADLAASEWEREWQYPMLQQALRQEALQATPYSSTAVSTGSQQYLRNPAAGAVGGALSGAAIGGLIQGGSIFGSGLLGAGAGAGTAAAGGAAAAGAGAAASGAATGAAAGSSFPIVGTAIGAIAGGLLGAFMN